MSEARTRSRGELDRPVKGPIYKYANGELSYTMLCEEAHDGQEISDVVIPNYHARSARGEIFNNPMSLKRSVVSYGAGGSEYQVSSTTGIRYEVPVAPTRFYAEQWRLSPTALSDLYVNQADRPVAEDMLQAAKLIALAQVDSSDYKFGESLLEARETLRFAKNPLKALKPIVNDFGRKARRKASRFKRYEDKIRAVEDVWLSYRFAVTPIWLDVEDAIEAFDTWKTGDERPVRLTSRGQQLFTHNVSDTVLKGSNTETYDTSSWYTEQAKAGIMYHVTDPVRDAQFILGLRKKDIPEALWAVVPYSFMVDRMLDISSAIRGLTNLADPSVRILSGWTTVKTSATHTCILSDRVLSNSSDSGCSGETVTLTDETYTRTPWLPNVSDVIPPLNVGGLVKDLTSIADLTALLHSRFKIFR